METEFNNRCLFHPLHDNTLEVVVSEPENNVAWIGNHVIIGYGAAGNDRCPELDAAPAALAVPVSRLTQ